MTFFSHRPFLGFYPPENISFDLSKDPYDLFLVFRLLRLRPFNIYRAYKLILFPILYRFHTPYIHTIHTDMLFPPFLHLTFYSRYS